MTLTLYFHPLSSFCQKVLIALYENDTPFERHIVNLGDPDSAASFKKVWPIGKFPVLRDDANDRTIPESTIIIEYLDQNYPGKERLIPEMEDLASRTRQADRFYDLYLQVPCRRLSATGFARKGERIRMALNRRRRNSRSRSTSPTRKWRLGAGQAAIVSAWRTARLPRPCTTPI
jgi:glutathione S-transferase